MFLKSAMLRETRVRSLALAVAAMMASGKSIFLLLRMAMVLFTTSSLMSRIVACNFRRKTKKMIPNIGKRRKNEVFKIHLEQVEKTTFSVEGFYLNEKTGKKK
jgi:uncharacterized membrane-anchored protein YitT (DUF2179 family)